MSMEIEAISEWLNNREIKHSLDKEENLIYFGAGGAVQTAHYIRVVENGEFFIYQIQLVQDNGYLNVDKEHKSLLPLLQYLMRENYIKKFGSWEYNYENGDIRFSIEIPFESDGYLTENQFNRICSLTFFDVDNIAQNILKILETGEMPIEEDILEIFSKKLKSLKQSLNQPTEDDEEDGI